MPPPGLAERLGFAVGNLSLPRLNGDILNDREFIGQLLEGVDLSFPDG